VRQLSPDELESAIKTAIMAELCRQEERKNLYFRDDGTFGDQHSVVVDGNIEVNALATAVAAALTEDKVDCDSQPPAGESPSPPGPQGLGTA